MDQISKLNKELKKTINDIFILKFTPPKCGEIKAKDIIHLNLPFMETSESYSNISDEPYNDFIKYHKNSGEWMKDFSYLKDNEDTIKSEEKDVIILNKKENQENNEEKEDNEENEENEQKEQEKKEKSNNPKYLLKCTECNKDKAIKRCSHCNKLLCQECANYFLKNEAYIKHKIEIIPANELNKEIAKDLFLKNFIEFIKFYLLKCDYLLKLESPNFVYPSIGDINDIKFHKKYIEQINELCLNNKNDNNDDKKNEEKKNGDNENDDNKNYIEIDARITKYIENLFGHTKKVHLSRSNSNIDEDFFSDEKSLGTNEEDDFDKIKNNLLYFINVVAKGKDNLNENLSNTIIYKFSNSLNIKNNNIFIMLNEKVNNFVKSKQFFDLKNQQINFENPILDQWKEVKLLTDNLLCNECKIEKKYFDCKGNFVNPNLSCNLIRGSEIYDPPYGWIGIGLNVERKYDNNDWLTNNTNLSEWAIAYHGLNSKISSDDTIKKLLRFIITKNLIKEGISKKKSNSIDIRHSKKVGEGIYLCPKIKNAEEFAGIISFNNKKYKVLFMAKVYIKEIREPQNTTFWVLDEKFIRIYRVLFKEMC